MSDSERDSFLGEAIEALRQEVPESLEWLFADDPPSLRWRGDGAVADRRLARGWLVLADRRDDWRPTRQQRDQASLIHPEDGVALALWLLETWIGFDGSGPAKLTEERSRELREMAERAAEVARRFNRGGTDPEERYRQLVTQESRNEPGSALNHPGLPALIVACASSGDVRIRSRIETILNDGQERPELRDMLEDLLAAIET